MDAEAIEDIFSAFGPVKVRRMFGGSGVYADGVMFALESGGVLYLKADGESEADFRAEDCAPFAYQSRGRTVALSYWILPERLLDEPDELCIWAGKAVAAARRAAEARRRAGDTVRRPAAASRSLPGRSRR